MIGYGLRDLFRRQAAELEKTSDEPEDGTAKVEAIRIVQEAGGRGLDIQNRCPAPARAVHVFVGNRRVTDFRRGTNAPKHPIPELAPGEERVFPLATGPAAEANHPFVRLEWTEPSWTSDTINFGRSALRNALGMS